MPTVTDIDGNVYTTITISTQTWMVSNLKTTKYRDGNTIPLVMDNVTLTGLSTPAYCWYNNDIVNKPTYGALYNWYAVNTENLCPTGWHVPIDAEWTVLTDYLGGVNIAGGKLKETGTTHWTSPNEGATNETGFTALPGGYRIGINGAFYFLGNYGYWWSSTEYDTATAIYRAIGYGYGGVAPDGYDKRYGFSVRCKRDN